MNEALQLNCPECGVRACCAEPGAKTPPPFCPMPVEAETLEEVERAYLQDENLHTLAVESARTEADGYCRRTRIEEIIDFARRLQVARIGIAHCVGMMREARLARDIFMAHGFEVHAVCCKVGAILCHVRS